MNHIPIKNNVSWVGKIDWDLLHFHGNEYSTHHGSSYNAYLIQEEKTVLIDTVWTPFAKEFVSNLGQIVDLRKIDYIVASHAEPDHCGALPELMRHIPDTPIYCTANSIKTLKGHYHQDWNFRIVKTGDKLSIGEKELVFIEAPMLHWPDTMFTYLTGDAILFSNDAFGQHYATEFMVNDQVNQAELLREAMKYYANILTPFSALVDKKIKEILAMKVPVDLICASHGVIWRDHPLQIVEHYQRWANQYQENQITVIYDTMWGGTRLLADNIAKGLREGDPDVTVKVFNTSNSDKNDVVTEVFRSKALVAGSSTINKGILSSMAGLLEEIRGLGFKNKKAATFGCYGWSGESVALLAESLARAGFQVVPESGYRAMWNPDEVALSGALDFGRKLAEAFH